MFILVCYHYCVFNMDMTFCELNITYEPIVSVLVLGIYCCFYVLFVCMTLLRSVCGYDILRIEIW